jgi:acetolactate synthase-1/3 small subunit
MNTATTTHYPAAPASQQVESHTLSVLVDNEPGAGARHRAVLRPRLQYRLAHGLETEHERHLTCITIVTRGTPMVIEQIKNQLERLVPRIAWPT